MDLKLHPSVMTREARERVDVRSNLLVYERYKFLHHIVEAFAHFGATSLRERMGVRMHNGYE